MALNTSGIMRAQMLGEPLPDSWAGKCLRELHLGSVDAMISVAENVTSALGGVNGPDFATWLRDTFEHLEAVDSSVLKALVALRSPLLTTNYDSLLEKATGCEAITWLQLDRVRQVLRGKDRSIVHLHGHWETPLSVVFGRNSYAELLAHDPAQTLQKAAASLRSLVFVGMGAGSGDPNFASLRAWLGSTFGTDESPHFRLCLESEVDNLEELHRGEGIVPVPFGSEYKDLERFLHDLLPVHVLPPSLTEQESGTLFVPDGVNWTKVHDLMNVRDNLTPKPFVRRYWATTLQSLESLLQACLFGSAVGYHPDMADVGDELHPLKQLRDHGLDWLFVPIEFQEFDLEVVVESHETEIDQRVRALRPRDRVSDYFKELVERDASRFFGTDESLDDESLDYSDYRFVKSFVLEHERLCEAVNDEFAMCLAELITPVGVTASSRSREAFVRRLIVAHLGIGYSYQNDVKVGVTLADDRQLMTSVMHVPSRAPGALGIGVLHPKDENDELLRRLLPFAMADFARRVVVGEVLPYEAIYGLRDTAWAKAARRALAAINQDEARASVEKAWRELERELQASLLDERHWLLHLSMPRAAIGHRALEDMVIATQVEQLLDPNLLWRFRRWLGFDS